MKSAIVNVPMLAVEVASFGYRGLGGWRRALPIGVRATEWVVHRFLSARFLPCTASTFSDCGGDLACMGEDQSIAFHCRGATTASGCAIGELLTGGTSTSSATSSSSSSSSVTPAHAMPVPISGVA